jgi:2,4-dienoyl-CoA reductase-like NADH-dependent reductase (Old Yellow Enzyme family)
LGGAEIVFTEATVALPEGSITHGDLGLWSNEHATALGHIVAFLKRQGTQPAIQLARAGRKASMQQPWFGNDSL